MRCDPERGLWIPEFGDASSERLSPYSRLDLSLSFLADLGRGEPTVFFVSLSNAFDHDNHSAVHCSTDYGERLATGQGFARTLHFGTSGDIHRAALRVRLLRWVSTVRVLLLRWVSKVRVLLLRWVSPVRILD